MNETLEKLYTPQEAIIFNKRMMFMKTINSNERITNSKI